MATKAKTLQVKDKEKDDKAADAPEKDSPDAPSPLLDLSDAAVKKMIKQAKKRGFVTFDQLNEVLPSDTTSPEQIEDIMSMRSDMGINVSEAEEADADEEKEEADDDTDNELVEVTQKAVTEVKKSEPGERTDDPVRMYLREMGTVELLSREGEIAIAKRIEAGREAMIAGLCESPLTFQAIIIWRDELNEGKVFLRDIISVRSIVKLISKHYYLFKEAIMSARETAELVLLVGRLVQADGYDGELSPAQWMALRFFARANSFSRTPSAFAEFQATTRGTASQAIKALEAGGYLVRQRSQADGRSVSLRLTSKGKKALARDPFEVLVRAVDSLDAKEQTAMHHALHQVLTTVAASGAHRRFGVCQDCTYLGGEMCCNLTSASPSALKCLLFGVPIQQIGRAHV